MANDRAPRSIGAPMVSVAHRQSGTEIPHLTVAERVARGKAARDNGYVVKDQDRIVLETVSQYRQAIRDFAGMKHLEVWYSRLEIEQVLHDRASDLQPRAVKRTQKALDKARTRDSMSAFSKL